MKRILWRLTAASSGVLVALSMNVGPASASSSGDHRPERNTVQVADQVARTEQDADSSAKSEQFLPINANVPVQILSLGHNGGDTKQSNNSTAKSAAVEPGRDRPVHPPVPEDVEARRPEARRRRVTTVRRVTRVTRVMTAGRATKGHDGGKGHKDHDGWKDHDRKGHGPKGDHGWKPEPGPIQKADQLAWTDQDAKSEATSKQFLPVNANVPVQILSLGSNGGDTRSRMTRPPSRSPATSPGPTSPSTRSSQVWKDEPKGHGPKGTARRVMTAGRATTAGRVTTTARVTVRPRRRANRLGPTRTPSPTRSRSRSCPSTSTRRCRS